MSTTYSPKIVTNGLVFYWDAANPKSVVSSSLTGSKDIVGSQVCTYTNLSGSNFFNNFFYTSSNLGTVCFSSSNATQSFGYIATGTSYQNLGLLISSSYTMEAWVNLTGYPFNAQAQGSLIFGGVGFTQGIMASLGGNSFVFSTFWKDTGSNNVGTSAIAPGTLITGSWYHVTGLYQYAPTMSAYIYLNGVLQASSSAYNNFASLNNVNLTIGGTGTLLGASPTQYHYEAFNGYIGLTKIYNRGLSSVEIKQNYDATRGRYGL